MFRKSAAKKLPASFASFTGQGSNGFSCTRTSPPSDAVGVVSPNFYNAPLKAGWLATDCYPKNKDCKQDDPQGCCYPWILTNTPYYMFASDGDPITYNAVFTKGGGSAIQVKFIAENSPDDVGIVYGGKQYYLQVKDGGNWKNAFTRGSNLGLSVGEKTTLTIGDQKESGRPFTLFNWVNLVFSGGDVVVLGSRPQSRNWLVLGSDYNSILFKFCASTNSDGSYVDPVATHTFQDRTLYYTPGVTCNELNPQCCTDSTNPRKCSSSGAFACAVLSSPNGSNDDPSFVNYGPDYICPGSSSGCGRHTGL
jgi:hypothetical protein